MVNVSLTKAEIEFIVDMAHNVAFGRTSPDATIARNITKKLRKIRGY